MRVVDGFHHSFDRSKILTTKLRFMQVMNICHAHETVAVSNGFPFEATPNEFAFINIDPVPLVESHLEIRMTNSFRK